MNVGDVFQANASFSLGSKPDTGAGSDSESASTSTEASAQPEAATVSPRERPVASAPRNPNFVSLRTNVSRTLNRTNSKAIVASMTTPIVKGAGAPAGVSLDAALKEVSAVFDAAGISEKVP